VIPYCFNISAARRWTLRSIEHTFFLFEEVFNERENRVLAPASMTFVPYFL